MSGSLRIAKNNENFFIKHDHVELIFDESAIERLADYTIICNNEIENIGARRLYTILEKLLEELLFALCLEATFTFLFSLFLLILLDDGAFC